MRILIIGDGICGLGTALLLAPDRYEVLVLERDADPVPASADAAWEHWERKGVAQFRQPHNFMPGRGCYSRRNCQTFRMRSGAPVRAYSTLSTRFRRSSPIARRDRSTSCCGSTPGSGRS